MRRVDNRVYPWIYARALTSAVSLILFGLACVIIALVAYSLWKDKDQSSTLNHVEDCLDQLKKGCDAQSELIEERIKELNIIDPGTEICINGLCTRYPSNADMLNLLGCWDAETNDPPIMNGVGNNTDAYIVCVNGTTIIDGNGNWSFGDLIIYVEDAGAWLKNDGSPESDPGDIGILPLDTFSINFTCSIWQDGITEVEIAIFDLNDGFYEIWIPPIMELNDGTSGSCVINATSPIPVMYIPTITQEFLHDHASKNPIDFPFVPFLTGVGVMTLDDNGIISFYAGPDFELFTIDAEVGGDLGTWGVEFIYDI